MMKTSLFVALACLCSSTAIAGEGGAASDTLPAKSVLSAIPALDVPRYMGTWFEIAKFPNRFQRKCSGGTRAEYSLKDDGRVQVINRCRSEDGETIEAVGIARQVGSADSAKLEVRFAPGWLSFLPFVWGDYWVIDLDRDYRLVAVSEPNREYLWILARTPRVAERDYRSLLARLSQQGFDPRKLEMTRQE